jgi:hypothetical protein
MGRRKCREMQTMMVMMPGRGSWGEVRKEEEQEEEQGKKHGEENESEGVEPAALPCVMSKGGKGNAQPPTANPGSRPGQASSDACVQPPEHPTTQAPNPGLTLTQLGNLEAGRNRGIPVGQDSHLAVAVEGSSGGPHKLVVRNGAI